MDLITQNDLKRFWQSVPRRASPCSCTFIAAGPTPAR